MKAQAIIPTAGTGARLKAPIPKPLIIVNGRPIFIHTLEAFEESSLIESVILVVQPDHLADYQKKVKPYHWKKK